MPSFSSCQNIAHSSRTPEVLLRPFSSPTSPSHTPLLIPQRSCSQVLLLEVLLPAPEVLLHYSDCSKTLASGESLSRKSVVFPFSRLFFAASSWRTKR